MSCCGFDEKFDTENNTIKEYNNWKILIRKGTKTLGNCVVMTKRHIERFSDITDEEILELRQVVIDLENALNKAFQNDKINWHINMMKDNHLHFHVYPRYEKPREFAGIEWIDTGWPTQSQKRENVSQEVLNQIKEEIIKFL